MSTALRGHIRNLEYEMTLIKAELEAVTEKNQDKKDKIEEIIKIVNEYRLSEDHTLTQAHLTLYKIDMDVLSAEYQKSIYSEY